VIWVAELLTETLFAAPVYKTYGGMIREGKFSSPGFKIALGQRDNRLIQLAAEKCKGYEAGRKAGHGHDQAMTPPEPPT
jgi:hypothetical protein